MVVGVLVYAMVAGGDVLVAMATQEVRGLGL